MCQNFKKFARAIFTKTFKIAWVKKHPEFFITETSHLNTTFVKKNQTAKSISICDRVFTAIVSGKWRPTITIECSFSLFFAKTSQFCRLISSASISVEFLRQGNYFFRSSVLLCSFLVSQPILLWNLTRKYENWNRKTHFGIQELKEKFFWSDFWNLRPKIPQI